MRFHVAAALLAALPPLLIVGWSLTRAVPQFFDPCFQWGVAQPAGMRIAPDSPCRAFAETTETVRHAIVRLALVQGGILVAVALGLMGALVARPAISVLGAALMLLESLPLMFSVGWVTAFASGLFLWTARAAPLSPRARFAMRLTGALAAVWALLCLPALYAAALFAILLMMALVFTAFVALWP